MAWLMELGEKAHRVNRDGARPLMSGQWSFHQPELEVECAKVRVDRQFMAPRCPTTAKLPVRAPGSCGRRCRRAVPWQGGTVRVAF